MAIRTQARTAAFMPWESPPLVKTASPLSFCEPRARNRWLISEFIFQSFALYVNQTGVVTDIAQSTHYEPLLYSVGSFPVLQLCEQRRWSWVISKWAINTTTAPCRGFSVTSNMYARRRYSQVSLLLLTFQGDLQARDAYTTHTDTRTQPRAFCKCVLMQCKLRMAKSAQEFAPTRLP